MKNSCNIFIVYTNALFYSCIYCHILMLTYGKKQAVKSISLAPTQGRKIENGQGKMIPADEIQYNDILRILPGETIPVDGIIITGETSVDQSIMTGESFPVDKGIGETVFCGTINRFGSIDIKATKVGEDSSLQKLIRMVQEAEEKQAPCSYYTRCILSMCINFLAVTLSVLGMLTPTTGALVHNADSCFVVLIAALLYDRKFE